MKRCTYCGKQYADDAEVCSLDQQPLDQLTEASKEDSERHEQIPSAFNARLVSHGISSGLYRVYLRGSDLLFIQTEQGEVAKHWDALAALLGPAGVLIGLLFKVQSGRKAKKALGNIDERDPEELARENEDNFRLFIPEIRDAAMELPSFLALSGKQAGRLHLFIRDGKRIKLELATADDMKTALDLLAPRLKATLRINMEWNETDRQFRKKKQLPLGN
jgi:hypothetical protein